MANLSITAVNFLTQPTPISLKLGETVADFDIVYVSQQIAYNAKCDDGAKLAAEYFCLRGGLINEWGLMIPLTSGLELQVTLGAGALVATDRYVLSTTAGKIMPDTDLASGNKLVEIGVGSATDKLLLGVKVTDISHA